MTFSLLCLSDSVYKKIQEAVVDKILIIGLIIFCLLVSYIIWQLSYSICTSIPSILGFNSSVLLIYKTMGAKWVYWLIWQVVGYTWYLLSFVWTYMYTSACLIIGLFIWSLVWQFIVWCKRTRRRKRKMHMLDDIYKRLKRMEEHQEERLKRIEEQQEEILKLLRANSHYNKRD